jgi:ureidoacrylate peracid hydrolase
MSQHMLYMILYFAVPAFAVCLSILELCQNPPVTVKTAEREGYTPKLITVPTKPDPLKIDLKRAALIVVDMQNAFCAKGGMFDLLGILNEPAVKQVIEVNKKLLDGARTLDMKIIYLRMGWSAPDFTNAGGIDSPNMWKNSGRGLMGQFPQWKDKMLVIDTWGWQIIEEMKPQPGDILVNKNRYSGFVNTDLDAVLRTHNIKYLVVTGVATNVCVESTIRDAFSHEYWTILITDGCASDPMPETQAATVHNVMYYFGWVATADDFLKAL